MSDPATMAYNAGFDVAYRGYHRDTGCIDFPAAEWDAWLRRVDVAAACGDRFHAMVEADGAVVGEAAFRVAHGTAHLHLVIEAAHAGRGHGSAALRLLVAEALGRLDVAVVADEFPASREAAERLFRRHGFVRDGARVTLARASSREDSCELHPEVHS